MKKAFLILLSFCIAASGANIKISDLPLATASSIQVSDSFPIVSGGVTKRLRLSDILLVPSLQSPTFTGTVTANVFAGSLFNGNGSGLTTLSATQLLSGTVPLSRISGLLDANIDASAAISLSKLATTTASRAIVSNGSGVITPATTTATEIGYVNGVTSAIQTQLNAKAASGANGDITSLTAATALTNASGVAVRGTNTNDSPTAGYVGEVISSGVAGVSFPSSGSYGDLTSISVTAGDWMITGMMTATRNGATVPSVTIGISTTSGNSATGLTPSTRGDNTGPTATYDTSIAIVPLRISLSGTTTYYLKFAASYTVATPFAGGRITAWRIR